MKLTIPENKKLIECEAIIERGLQTFYDVGNALLVIRDERLYRQDFDTFEEYCSDRWNMARSRAYQLMGASSVINTLSTMVDKVSEIETPANDYPLPTSERQTRPLTSLEPEQQREAWRQTVESAPNGKITASHVEQVVERLNGAYKPHVAHNSGNNEWYTPLEYIEAARQVLSTIDLDPASSLIANEQVKATQFYDIESNGLEQQWQGKIWLNPPYASNLIAEFIDKLKAHVVAQDVTEAIVLVNNATETAWFQSLVSVSNAVIFTNGRVKFWAPDRSTSSPLQGQAILYIGEQTQLFLDVFSSLGWGAIIHEL